MTPDTEPSDGAKLATIFMVLAIYLLWRIAA